MAKTNALNHPKQKKGLHVIGNPLINTFLASSPPTALRSKHYTLQAMMGFSGILLIFFSFKMPMLFFAGAILLLVRRQWRIKTDDHAMNYRHAITALKKKKYADCIQYLNKIPFEEQSMHYLDLVKASCYLELEDTESAYTLYCHFFETTPSSHWSDPLYWSARENAVVLSLQHDNIALAKKILNAPNDQSPENTENCRWKVKYAEYIDES